MTDEEESVKKPTRKQLKRLVHGLTKELRRKSRLFDDLEERRAADRRLAEQAQRETVEAREALLEAMRELADMRVELAERRRLMERERRRKAPVRIVVRDDAVDSVQVLERAGHNGVLVIPRSAWHLRFERKS